MIGALRPITLALLLASATGAQAQVPGNGPEWGFKDHQPTQAGVIKREQQAGVRAPTAQVRQNERTIDRLGRTLLQKAPLPP